MLPCLLSSYMLPFTPDARATCLDVETSTRHSPCLGFHPVRALPAVTRPLLCLLCSVQAESSALLGAASRQQAPAWLPANWGGAAEAAGAKQPLPTGSSSGAAGSSSQRQSDGPFKGRGHTLGMQPADNQILSGTVPMGMQKR